MMWVLIAFRLSNNLQAYEKEDEVPAAVPAEKKEKAAEKVAC